jgi:hypothetical protein
MSDPAAARAAMNAEMERTRFQRKAVATGSMQEVMDDAIAYFKERGYRSGKTGRPNQIFVMGRREGAIPRVNAEILIQVNVGKGKATMVTISGFGEELSKHLEAYTQHLREQARAARQARGDTGTESNS